MTRMVSVFSIRRAGPSVPEKQKGQTNSTTDESRMDADEMATKDHKGRKRILLPHALRETRSAATGTVALPKEKQKGSRVQPRMTRMTRMVSVFRIENCVTANVHSSTLIKAG